MFLARLFKRKRGGTAVGNWIRRRISANTWGISDEIGLTDGHRNGGIGQPENEQDGIIH